jgi:hypothetical protein
MYELYARRPATFDTCTEISDLCPVEATVLGYVPNKGSSIFFTICFAILFFSAVGIGIWKRTWTYAATLGAGLLLETIGRFCQAHIQTQPVGKT